MSRALAGIRVIELADRSAALAGRILADLGAEVIMVEPQGGATIRHQAPFVDDRAGPDRAFGHLYFNTNKHSVTLNLDDENERETFRKLIFTADVCLRPNDPASSKQWG